MAKKASCGSEVAHREHEYDWAEGKFLCPGLKYPDAGAAGKAVKIDVDTSPVEITSVVIVGVGEDVPIVVNERGAGQSAVPFRFDLVDAQAMFKMTSVLAEGAAKYGPNNWRALEISDHLNHLIMHAYAWLAGDRSDEHLSHIMCRAMFAQGVDANGGVMDMDDIKKLNADRA